MEIQSTTSTASSVLYTNNIQSKDNEYSNEYTRDMICQHFLGHRNNKFFVSEY